MRFTLPVIIVAGLMITLFSCTSKPTVQTLKENIQQELQKQTGDFAVAFKNLDTGEELLINETEVFHAASTMKTPVLIEVCKQAVAGKFSLFDSLVIENSFISIVDSSTFSVKPTDDSEQELYKHIGEKRSISLLCYDMITSSSNLATNMIVELVGAENVTQTMQSIGAPEMKVLRGVEDSLAFHRGLINTTTAHDQMIMYEKIATGQAVNKEASEIMMRMLRDQKFNEIIPALLPEGVKVAHKTGSITGVHHDGGIVVLPDGKQYVLVLLSKNAKDEAAVVKALANVSKLVYDSL